MPIHCAIQMQPCSTDNFYELDHLITGIAFKIQNNLGRFLDERVYKNELDFRLRTQGVRVDREVRFTVSYATFRKDYAADLVMNGRVVVEVKTADKINEAHRAQTLNYLYLSNTRHGTLLNFRPAKVGHEFLSTRLDADVRRQMRWAAQDWRPLSSGCRAAKECLSAIIAEWGGFLEIGLYREAISHLAEAHEQLVPIHCGSRQVGQQSFHLLNEHIILAVTSVTKKPEAMRFQLEKLLSATRLKAIQWINFNRHVIELATVTKPK